MDSISEMLEELVLDAIIAALEKIKQRNVLFLIALKKNINTDIQF